MLLGPMKYTLRTHGNPLKQKRLKAHTWPGQRNYIQMRTRPIQMRSNSFSNCKRRIMCWRIHRPSGSTIGHLSHPGTRQRQGKLRVTWNQIFINYSSTGATTEKDREPTWQYGKTSQERQKERYDPWDFNKQFQQVKIFEIFFKII